jgi:uncharacterized protein
MAWEAVAGTGEVHSWIVTHQVYAPAFVELVPYTTVLVRLDEQDDILIPGPLISTGSEAKLQQGLRMRAVALRVADTIGQLAWTTDVQQ